MRIAIIAHSSVHPRQQFFYESIAELGNYVLVLGPRRWNNLTLIDRKNSRLKPNHHSSYKQIGLSCNNEGSLFNFKLLGLLQELQKFVPDIIYCQQEWWSDQAWDAFCLSIRLKCKFSLFCWENIVYEDIDKLSLLRLDRTVNMLKALDLIVCGNEEAAGIVSFYTDTDKILILPQVGIDEKLFNQNVSIADINNRLFDLLYVGREVPEKGIEVLKRASNALSLNLKIAKDFTYHELPAVYNSAKIFVSIPYTTSRWKEQSGSYTNLEAMACCLPVITTGSGAIREYLKDKAFYIVEGDLTGLVEHISTLMSDINLRESSGIAGRKLILDRYTNKVIAEKLMEKFHEICR